MSKDIHVIWPSVLIFSRLSSSISNNFQNPIYIHLTNQSYKFQEKKKERESFLSIQLWEKEEEEEKIMEGLIPFFLNAIKKPKPHNKYNRSKSELSNRSYHLLNAEESFSGSSHRRTRSEFQPPAMEFVQQRPGNGYNHSSGVHQRSTSSSSVGSYPSQVPNKANNFAAIHCWCKSFPFFFFFVCVKWLILFIYLFMSYSFKFFVVYKWWRPLKLHQNDGSPSIVLLYFHYCCWIVL